MFEGLLVGKIPVGKSRPLLGATGDRLHAREGPDLLPKLGEAVN